MERILGRLLGIFVATVLYGIGCEDDGTGSTTPNPSDPSSTSSTSTGVGGVGGGMATSSTTGTAGNGQGGSVPECTVPDDCQDPGSVCFVRTCIDHICGKAVQNGLEVSPLAVGDCKHRICDANGDIVVAADTSDIYDDGNGCTADTCNGQTPENHPVAEGYLCADGLCGTLWTGIACRECLVNVHCIGNPMEPLCQDGKCVAATCGNGMKDPNEAAIDCGKDCKLCDDNSPCNSQLDCKSSVCSGTPKTCQPATCMDNLPNGKESDTDCGGPDCPKCAETQVCILASDCESGVCLPSVCDAGVCPRKCQAPSCTDGVANQTETDIDCGGSCPMCPP